MKDEALKIWRGLGDHPIKDEMTFWRFLDILEIAAGKAPPPEFPSPTMMRDINRVHDVLIKKLAEAS